MYNDNKYQNICTSEISYLTYFKKQTLQTSDVAQKQCRAEKKKKIQKVLKERNDIRRSVVS